MSEGSPTLRLPKWSPIEARERTQAFRKAAQGRLNKVIPPITKACESSILAEDKKGLDFNTKPRRRVKTINWVNPCHGQSFLIPCMNEVASFVGSLPLDGPLRIILDKIPRSRGTYIIGRTLHINIHKIEGWLDDLNYISLVTHFGLVNEVRIHTFSLHFYITSRRQHCRIHPSTWGLVQLLLPHIVRGPLVTEGTLTTRKVKITFDDFLKPAIDAWRTFLPFQHLVEALPDLQLISNFSYIWWVHSNPAISDDDYTSTSEAEIDDIDNEDEDSGEDDGSYGIMDVDGIPQVIGRH